MVPIKVAYNNPTTKISLILFQKSNCWWISVNMEKCYIFEQHWISSSPLTDTVELFNGLFDWFILLVTFYTSLPKVNYLDNTLNKKKKLWPWRFLQCCLQHSSSVFVITPGLFSVFFKIGCITNLIRMHDSGLQQTEIIINWLGIYRDVWLHKDYILRNCFFKFVLLSTINTNKTLHMVFSLGFFLSIE